MSYPRLFMHLCIVSLLTLASSSCGQKGPLVYPEKDEQDQATSLDGYE